MKTPDLLVLGAGISGLTLAHDAAREGLQVHVLEQAPAVGGCVFTERLPSGFWFELGAHTAYNSYGGMLARLEQAGRTDAIVPRRKAPFRLLVGDAVRSVFSALSLLELLWNGPKVFFLQRAGRTVAEYFGRIVGPGNWARVFRPLLSAVPSQRPDDIPADMLFKKRPRRKSYPKSFTLQGGLTTFLEALSSAPGLTIETDARAARVRREGALLAVELADGRILTANHVAVAVPPAAAAALLLQDFPEAAAQLQKIGQVTLRSYGVVVPREQLTLAPAAGIVPLDGRYFSAVSRDVLPDEKLRGFTFHCAPTVTRAQALALAAATLGVPEAAFVHVAEREVVLPSPRLGHDAIVKALDEALAGQPLYLTGNYFAGLALEDCIQRSSAEAMRLSAAVHEAELAAKA